MDASRWDSLSSGQAERKRTFQQMQRSHTNGEHHFPSSFLPNQQRRPHNNNHNINKNNNNTAGRTTTTNSFGTNHNAIMADRVRNRMASRQSPYPPPSLQHRTSQTVIDLTEDSDEPPSPPPRARLSVPGRNNQRFPRLGRDDILGGGEFIDLTDENGNHSGGDSELVEVLQRHPVMPRPHHHHHVHNHHHHAHNHAHHSRRTLPHIPPRGFDHRRPAGLAPPHPVQPERSAEDLFLPHGPNDPHRLPGLLGLSNTVQRVIARLPDHRDIMDLFNRAQNDNPALSATINAAMQMQGMQGMNYDARAFGADHVVQPPPPKAPYRAPPPAEPGFTRSPAALGKDEILICPACEEELVQHQPENPPPTTNARGKALTDKERAEHPFWVVKMCGHVFCNKCYQNRKDKSEDAKFYTPGKDKTQGNMRCAVDGCRSAVAKPDCWIGIFL